MNIKPYEPRSMLSDFRRHFFTDWMGDTFPSDLTQWMPCTDICETNEAFSIKVDIPGVAKKDINITVDGGVLTVNGHRKQEHEEKEHGEVVRHERFEGNFSRRA